MKTILQRLFNFCKRNSTPTVLCIFFGLGLFGVFRHEMWRDEMQAWLIARDSISIRELLANLRYEGHPPAWHLLLYLITRFANQPIFTQAFHLSVATLALWVFLKFSPFSMPQKVLFTFGYFPFYEYAIKCRSYALGILLIFIFCAIFPSRNRKYPFLFGLLFLISQVNLMAALIAIGLGAILLLELCANGGILGIIKRWDISLGVLLFFCGIALIAHFTLLPSDAFHPWSPEFFTRIDLKRVASTIGNINGAYFILFSKLPWRAGFILSLVELSFISLIFLRQPRIIFLYLFVNLGILSVFYVKYGSVWHVGHLYILFVVCLWLAEYLPQSELKLQLFEKTQSLSRRYRDIFIVFMLCVNFIAGVRVSIKDWKHPYSASKETADFIKSNNMDSMLMLGDPDFAVSAVAGYLSRKIYYPLEDRFGSYCRWDQKRSKRGLRPDEVVKKSDELMSQYRQSILIILNYELSPADMPSNMIKLNQFTRSSISTEMFYLYFIPYQKVAH